MGWAKAVMLTGSIIMPGICSYLITTHGIVNALYIIAVLCSGVTFTTSLFIEWAPHDYKQRIEQSAPMISNHNSTSRAYVRHQIPLKELVLIKQFWMYLLVVLSTQMVYPFFAYFFKIGHSFGQSLPQLVPFFQNIFLIALFLRIFVGFLLDRLKFGTGMFSLGSKNMLLFSFPLQAVALVCLLPISEAGDFHAFVILCGVVLLTFLITQSTIPVLALEQFGPTNSAIVFGVGSGVGLGVGEFGTMVLAGIIEKRGMSNGVLTPASYNNYYLIASAGTIVGLVLCLAIRPYTVEEGNMKDGKILEMESGEQEYLLKESDYAAVE